MQTHTKIIFAALAVIMLGVSLPSVAAQSQALQYEHTAGIVTLSTDDIEVRVVGANEQPHFHWWSPTIPDFDYHMRFLSIYEIDDYNENGVYDHGIDPHISTKFMLPTTDWEFSGFETVTEGGNITEVHFNFTSVSGFDPRPEGVTGEWNNTWDPDTDVFVQILVHIDMDRPGEVKFDLVIDGWSWVRENDSLLVFQFVITESNHGDGEPENAPRYFNRTANKFEFSNGYMEYEPTALAAQNTLAVNASHEQTTGLYAGESVYLSFPYFGNDTLFYDPIVGINSDAVVPADAPLIDTPTLYLAGAAIGVIALVAIVLKVRK
ncbi:MAG: hypothetical protein RTU63_12285 [Candidatus Thorarchaeota archaeon]